MMSGKHFQAKRKLVEDAKQFIGHVEVTFTDLTIMSITLLALTGFHEEVYL